MPRMIPGFKPGQTEIDHKDLNAIVDAKKQLDNLTVSYPLTLSRGPSGLAIAMDPNEARQYEILVGSDVNGIGLGSSWTYWTGGGILVPVGNTLGFSYNSATGEVTWTRSNSSIPSGYFIVTLRTLLSIPQLSGNTDFRYEISLWVDTGSGSSPLHTLNSDEYFRGNVSTGTVGKTINGWAIQAFGNEPTIKMKIGAIRTFGSTTAVVFTQAQWEILILPTLEPG